MKPFNPCIVWRGALATVASLFLTGKAQAQSVLFDVDFEPPTYSPGYIGGGNFAGQDNWYGFGSQFVSTGQAHSGSQSLNTTSSGTVSKAFSNTQDGTLNIATTLDWYFQTWVYVLPGQAADTATFAIGNSISGMNVSFTGDGRISYNTALVGQTDTIGSALFNQWLQVTWSHTAADGQYLHISVTGNGVNDVFYDRYGPQGSPTYLAFTGPTAYWDDVIAGYGAAPSVEPVPEPTTLALIGLGGFSLISFRRFKS